MNCLPCLNYRPAPPAQPRQRLRDSRLAAGKDNWPNVNLSPTLNKGDLSSPKTQRRKKLTGSLMTEGQKPPQHQTNDRATPVHSYTQKRKSQERWLGLEKMLRTEKASGHQQQG